MNRRGFLTSILALGAAPAIVRAESLMKLWVPPQEIWVPNGIRSIADGNFHLVEVVHQWLGVSKTRFFVDSEEVAGIKEVSFNEANGEFQIGANLGKVEGRILNVPRYQPGNSFMASATMKFWGDKCGVGAVHVQDDKYRSLYLENRR